MTDTKKPRKLKIESANQIMARIETQDIETRVQIYQQLKAHLQSQKEQADGLVKQLNGIK